MKERDLRIDVLKGIGIICVVWAHLRGYFDMEIYIFHMPIFFFLSGMFFHNRKDFLIKRFRSLIVPFLLYTLLFSLLFYLQGGAWMKPLHRFTLWYPAGIVGPLWFLIALFNISVVYYLLDCLIKRDLWLLLSAFAIGLLFYYYDVDLPFYLRQSCYALPFYALGRFMRGRKYTDMGMSGRVLSVAAVVFAVTVAYCRINNFRFDILCAYLPSNALLFYGGATSAILLLLNIKYFSVNTLSCRILSSFGRHSLAIMALHMPYMFFLRRQIFRLHLFESPVANTVGTFFLTFIIIIAGSYLLALLIDAAVRWLRQTPTRKFSPCMRLPLPTRRSIR